MRYGSDGGSRRSLMSRPMSRLPEPPRSRSKRPLVVEPEHGGVVALGRADEQVARRGAAENART